MDDAAAVNIETVEDDQPAILVPGLKPDAWRLARWALAAFVLTFLAARILVLLIMTQRMPDLFFYVGQTHVHHLNYGIFMLSAVGAWLLFWPPETRRWKRFCALLYGVGLALTFDEFGMWLHLGGSYWQRGSYDAVVTLGAILLLIAFAPSIRRFGFWQWGTTAAIGVSLFVFSALAADKLKLLAAFLKQIEQTGPK